MVRLRCIISLSFCYFLFVTAHGQLVPFSLAAPNDADFSQLSIIDSTEYYALSKLKGLGGGKSNYALECYDRNFRIKWSNGIGLNENQNIIGLERVKGSMLVFISEHDLDQRLARLIVKVYSKSGKVLSDPVVAFENSINSWQDVPEKGRVSETIGERISSIQPIGFVSPLQYRYQIRRSPDSSRVLLYRYIHDQKGLISQVKLFDHNMQLLHVGLIPIDRGFTSYGFEPTTSAKVFLYKSNKGGKVAVIRYDLETNESEYLALEGASTQRENLKLVVESENKVCLYKLNKQGNALSGVSYTVYDFESSSIAPTIHYELTTSIKGKFENSESEEREHFQIIGAYHFINGERLVILEDQRVEAGGSPIESNRASHPKYWNSAAIGSVATGPLLFVFFDKGGNVKWAKERLKYQKVSHTDGLNSASTLVNVYSDRVECVYANTPKGLFLNQLHYFKIDFINGEMSDDKMFLNQERLVIARPYCGWRPGEQGGFIFVGKKGLLGKKSFIQEINFN